MKRLAALLWLVSPAVLLADTTLRCGNRLVYTGDNLVKVESLCGKPSGVTTSSVIKPQTVWRNGRPYPLGEAVVQVETWVYNFGPRKFMRQLRFEDGTLVKIDTLDYGYIEPKAEAAD